MFLIILVVVLVGAAAHVALAGGERTRERAGELVLLWTLVGYCGIPMLVVGVMVLVRPEATMEAFGFPPGNPISIFFGWAYLAMALTATLSLGYRGPYLVAPAMIWATFFLGATFVHLGEGPGGNTHGDVLIILPSHGLVSAILVVALAASGMWRRGRTALPSRK